MSDTTETSTRAGRNDWMDEALCWWLTSDQFHPVGGGASAHEARAACALCPVTAQCLAYAMRTETNTYREGVYGGTTPNQRSALARAGWQPGDPIPTFKDAA